MTETIQQRAARSGAWAGIAAAILLIVSFFVFGTPPDNDASGEELARFLVDNRGGGLVAVLLMALAIPLFAVFASTMKDRFADSVGSGIAAMAAIAGLLYWLIDGMATALFFGAGWVDGDAHAATPEVAQTLWSAVNTLLAMSAPLGALFLAVAAIAGLQGALAKWHGWVTAVIAVVVLIGVLGVVATGMAVFGFLGSLLFLIWMILTSVLTIVRRDA